MKFKSTPLLFALMMILSIGLVNNAMAQKKKTTAKAPAKKASAATLNEGKGLLAKSDCLSCHKLDVKLVGPAYKDVAAKYPATEANIAALTKKILAGGSGVWGEVPMSPHPDLATADVRKMVAYILSVK